MLTSLRVSRAILVEGEQVRRIDHRDQHHVVLLLEQERAEAPRLRLRQLASHRRN